MSMRPRYPWWVILIAGIGLLGLCLLALGGCVESDTRSSQQATTHATHTIQGDVTIPITIADGTVRPVPVAVNLTISTDSATDTSGQSQTKTGIDPAVIGAIISQIKSQIPGLGVIGSLLTTGQAAPQGWSNGLVGGLATAAGGLSAAAISYLNSRAHKKDADEAWDKLAARPGDPPTAKKD